MTRDEPVQAVRRIVGADGSEAELDGLLALVERNVLHPAISDVIFHPPNGAELSCQEGPLLGRQFIDEGLVRGHRLRPMEGTSGESMSPRFVSPLIAG